MKVFVEEKDNIPLKNITNIIVNVTGRYCTVMLQYKTRKCCPHVTFFIFLARL